VFISAISERAWFQNARDDRSRLGAKRIGVANEATQVLHRLRGAGGVPDGVRGATVCRLEAESAVLRAAESAGIRVGAGTSCSGGKIDGQKS
jgi:hypothetical protein